MKRRKLSKNPLRKTKRVLVDRKRIGSLEYQQLEPRMLLAGVQAPDGLVGWWPGNGDAADLVNGNDGLLQNGTTFAAGKVGQAFSLDGIDDFVQVPHASVLNGTTGLTIEAWIKSEATSGARVIVSKWNDDANDWSYIFKDHNSSDKLRIELSENTHNDLADLSSATSIATGDWIHVAATYDNNTVLLYFDGAVDASQTVGPNRFIDASVTDLLIGAVVSGGTNEQFSGLIDEVSIYNRALEAAEIQSIYDAGGDGKFKPMAVVGSDPSAGSGLTSLPTDFTIDFSFPYDDTTVQPGDLTVNGTPADSVDFTDPDTLTFQYIVSPVTNLGLYTMSISGGAIQTSSAEAVDPDLRAWSRAFHYELVSVDSLLISGPDTITLGEDYLLNLTADPSLDIQNWTIDWGDGSAPQFIPGNPSTVVHVYASPSAGVAISATANSASLGALDAVVATESRYDGVTIQDVSRLFGTVRDVAVASDQSLFVAAMNHRAIHKRDANDTWSIFIPQGTGGLFGPRGLAIGSDQQTLFVSESKTVNEIQINEILKFDATTGEFLGVHSSATELNGVRGITFGPGGDLYVANLTANNVLRISAQNGQVLQTYTHPDFSNPRDLTFGPDGKLYVSSLANDRVLKFDVVTGIGSNFIWDDPGTPQVDETGGLDGPVGMGFGADGSFYLSSVNNKQLMKYDDDGSMGTFNQVVRLDWTSRGLTFGPDGDLYVAHGDFVDRLQAVTDIGLETLGGPSFLLPRQIAFDAVDNLYIADREGKTVFKYDFATDSLQAAIGPSDGLTDPWGLAVAPLEISPGNPHPAAGDLFVASAIDGKIFRVDVGTSQTTVVADTSAGFQNPLGLDFGPDGSLYFTSNDTGEVWRINFTGNGDVQSVESLVIDDPGGLINSMTGLDFGPDGNLYIAQGQPHVLKYDMQTGELSIFVDNDGWDFNNTHFDVRFGPDGDLYAAARIDENVLRYDGTTGQLIDIFTAHQPYRPLGLAFDSNGDLWTGSKEDGMRVQKYTGPFHHEHADDGSNLLVQIVSIQPAVVFSDSFENGQWNGLWVDDNQNDWFTNTQRSVDGSYSAEVDGKAINATLTVANSIDLSSYGSAELTFSWYIESSFDSGEYVKLEFSTDGINWGDPILSLDGNIDSENTWINELVQLDPQYLHSNFQFRFSANVSNSQEDANVDNVQLLATSLVGPPNTAPTTTGISDALVNEDSAPTIINLFAAFSDTEDLDSDLTYSITANTNPALFGSTPIDGVAGTLTLNYAANANGFASITVRATDTGGLFVETTFGVTVAPVNDAPVAADDNVNTTEETTLVISAASLLSNDIDDDQDPLFISSFTQPTSGAVVDNGDGSYTYTPNNGFTGADAFNYSISDGNGGTDTATVNITVTPVNDPPTTTGISDVLVNEDSAATVVNLFAAFNDTEDLDGDLTYSITANTNPAMFSSTPIDGAAGTLTLNYAADANGFASITVRATDTGGLYVETTFGVTVNPVNDAPVANDDNVNATEDTPLVITAASLLSNDSDIDLDPLFINSFTQPGSGVVVDDGDGSYTYTPDNGFTGADSYTYTISDGNGGTDTATVNITVDTGFTPTVVFSDSFGSVPWDGQWVQDSQNDWFQGSNAIDGDGSSAEVDGKATNATLTVSSPIDMTAYGSAELTFSWFIANSLDNGEYLALDFFDGIINDWIEVHRLNGSNGNGGDENTWFNETVNLDPQYLHSQSQFRFRAKFNKSDELANVDNVQLIGTSEALRGSVMGQVAKFDQLNLHQITPLAAWAESLWQLDDQRSLDYQLRIADLPGNLLGLTHGQTITIDADAAGMGWFVDATPWESSEFVSDFEVARQYDLLTVLAHEFGHLYGHDHTDHGVMDAVLNPGERSLTGDYNGADLAAYSFGRGDSNDPAQAKRHDQADDSPASGLQSIATNVSELSGSLNGHPDQAQLDNKILDRWFADVRNQSDDLADEIDGFDVVFENWSQLQ